MEAVAVLKRTNNDVASALDEIQSQPREVLLSGGKKPRLDKPAETPVDELSLAQLLSMGFEQPACESALRASKGSVEDALMALTAQQTQSFTSAAGPVAEAAGEASSASSSPESSGESK